MEITRNNYEAFLLDRLEGRLSPGQEEELREFLRMNPDCPAGELKPGAHNLAPEKVLYPFRERLKKEIPLNREDLEETDFELFSIARLEGDLTPGQASRHEALVRSDREKMSTWEILQKTRLVARSVSFPGKEGLKRNRGIYLRLRTTIRGRTLWTGLTAIAAAIALLFLLFRPVAMETATEVARVEAETPVNGTASDIQSDIQDEEPSPELPVTIQRERQGSSPVTLSIKKKQDPPELTGAGRSGTSPAGAQRLRVAALAGQPAPLPGKELYDRIRPLELPPSRVRMSPLTLSRLTELDMEGIFESLTDNELSFWTIANSGIEGINRIAGTDMTLLAHRDEEGEVSGIEFKSRIFSFTRPLDRGD